MGSKTPPSDALAGWLAAQRWFATKTRRITGLVVVDRIPLGGGTLDVVAVTLDDGAVDRYVVARLPRGPAIADAFDDAPFCRATLRLVADGAAVAGERSTLAGRPTRAFPAGLAADLAVRRLTGEQSNTSVVFGRALIGKYFRRLAEGVSPDAEITRFLTEHTTFRHTPRLAGVLDYRPVDGAETTLAIVQEFVEDGRDGWQWLLARLAAGDAALPALRRLGERTAQLHQALATPTGDPAFAAEPISGSEIAEWARQVHAQLDAARAAAPGRPLPDLPDVRPALAGLLSRAKLRHHGDFHLGQTLATGDGADFMIIDFEGEPLRPLAERRRKHTPLRDVAGMLRSLGYAAATAGRGGDGRAMAEWEPAARTAFVEGYRAAAGDAQFLPRGAEAFAAAVAVFEVEKAAYEVVYEANNRPDWIDIPLGGLVRASASLRPPQAPAGAA